MGAGGDRRPSSAGSENKTCLLTERTPPPAAAAAGQAPSHTLEGVRPTRLYRRKDYAAACQQHVAYLRCLQSSGPLSWNACKEEYDAFDSCVQVAVAPAHLKANGAMAVNAWEQLKQDPVVLA